MDCLFFKSNKTKGVLQKIALTPYLILIPNQSLNQFYHHIQNK